MMIQEPINPQSFQPLSPSVPPPASFTQAQIHPSLQTDQVFTAEEEKPKIFKIISAFLFFIAFLYGLTAVMITGVILIINRAESNAGGPDFNFLKYFPAVGLIPFLILLATLFFLIAALKIRDGSRSSWWMGVISLIAIPIPLDLIIVAILTGLSKSTQTINSAQGENIIGSSLNLHALGRLIYAFAIFELALLPLLIFFKKFHFAGQSLSKKAKIFITIIIIVFVLPIISMMSYGYYKTTDTDYGYNKVKFGVNYHVYKPQFIPGGRVNSTIFIPKKELAGIQNAIQVAYGTPLDEMMKGKTSSLIIMKQVGINPGFDLKSFAPSVFKEPTSIEQMPLSLAVKGNAYLIQKTSGKLELKILTFITPDNVLITITTPNASKEELIQLAESLR